MIWNRDHNVRFSLIVLVGINLLFGIADAQEPSVLSAPVTLKSAVRFFFNPGNYYHWPLVLRVVGANDRRLESTRLVKMTRVAYVTPSEMETLDSAMKSTKLPWDTSPETKRLNYDEHLPIVYAMVVTVFSSTGTATTRVEPGKICGTLPPLTSAITSPRALWEFKLFLKGYGCDFPGFNYDAYPDHIRKP
jgi:hypothetical protein